VQTLPDCEPILLILQHFSGGGETVGNSMQIKLDFTQPKIINDEKKTELISFRAGEKFKSDLQAIARAKNIDLSNLLFEYALSGFLDDYKNILLLQASNTKTIAELLR
jgi:hypothetical protein